MPSFSSSYVPDWNHAQWESFTRRLISGYYSSSMISARMMVGVPEEFRRRIEAAIPSLRSTGNEEVHSTGNEEIQFVREVRQVPRMRRRSLFFILVVLIFDIMRLQVKVRCGALSRLREL